MSSKYQWVLVNGGGEIYSVTFGYCAIFDESEKDSFKYTLEDIEQLEKIKRETPEPTLPENPFKAQEIMRTYGNKIRNKFESK